MFRALFCHHSGRQTNKLFVRTSPKSITTNSYRLQQTQPSLSANLIDPNIKHKQIQRLLIANRGEIACRIIRTARRLGIETIAVYSDADQHSLHVALADQAFHIGPSPAIESYLVKEKLIDVALRSQSDAIHPGYGFLSESHEFSTICTENDIVFVGPSPDSIKSMGVKSLSKTIMIDAGVPVIPGFHNDSQQNSESLLAEARKIGFPVMIKAVRGGGGKGMRISLNEQEFITQLDSARREAMKAFGDDVVLLEKYVSRPRHVEVQIFGDNHNNCVHLFERDCSSQRRHQKVIEEAPAPHITAPIREELGTAAVKAAKAVKYCGAGTVEFIFDTTEKKFYFMEMNTRLQVEHPVTEMITGLDLVEWQLRVASGEPLPRTQSDFISPIGHSFEARIYAEDADSNFMPCTGVIESLTLPAESNEIRIETGVRSGDEISVFYDPMIAKLVVWAPDRRSALMKLRQSLNEYRIAGLKTNVDYLIRLASHPTFEAGDVYTDFIKDHSDELKPVECTDQRQTNLVKVVAALSLLIKEKSQQREDYLLTGNDINSPFNSVDGRWFSGSGNILAGERRLTLKSPSGDKTDLIIQLKNNFNYSIEVLNGGDSSTSANNETFEVICHYDVANGEMDLTFTETANRQRFKVLTHGERSSSVFTKQYGVFNFEQELPSFLENADSDSAGGSFDGRKIVSPMPALIEKILVNAGDKVRSGDTIAILTAMKMEYIIRASFEDSDEERVVEQVYYKQGDSIPKGAKIVQFVQSDDSAK